MTPTTLSARPETSVSRLQVARSFGHGAFELDLFGHGAFELDLLCGALHSVTARFRPLLSVSGFALFEAVTR